MIWYCKMGAKTFYNLKPYKGNSRLTHLFLAYVKVYMNSKARKESILNDIMT